MSETLCTLRTKGGGGGRYKETSLWTNSAPSSDFAAQTITLSDSLSNYKYIAIKYCYNKSYTSITNKVIYLVDDFKTATQSTSTNHTVGGLSVQGSDNKLYTRNIFYVSDTSVSVSLSQLENGSGTYAAGAIPLEILGLNELAQGEKPVIPTFSIQIAAANNRSAAAMNLDVASYNTLTIGSVTKGSGVTVRNAQIRDVNNTVLYNINVSSSEQTFDVSAQTRVVIVLDASGTTAWQELKADNFYLS